MDTKWGEECGTNWEVAVADMHTLLYKINNAKLRCSAGNSRQCSVVT